MRLGKVFLAVFGGVEASAFVALGFVAHRLDLFVDFQLVLAPIAVAAGVVATLAVLVRERRPAARASRPTEDVPHVDAHALSERIGAPAPVLAPHRRDARIEGTHRP